MECDWVIGGGGGFPCWTGCLGERGVCGGLVKGNDNMGGTMGVGFSFSGSYGFGSGFCVFISAYRKLVCTCFGGSRLVRHLRRMLQCGRGQRPSRLFVCFLITTTTSSYINGQKKIKTPTHPSVTSKGTNYPAPNGKKSKSSPSHLGWTRLRKPPKVLLQERLERTPLLVTLWSLPKSVPRLPHTAKPFCKSRTRSLVR